MIKTKTTAFIDVFNQKNKDGEAITGIEVPIIQRDYAQGRETKEVTRIRNQFVNALLKALQGGKEDAITLDFVYGNVENDKLIPLDGQQRLTTLFLLHWYIAKKENIEEDKIEFLSRFRYRTRFSSNNFCERIVDCSPNFDTKNLSEWIIDQNWFMYSWEKDPTVRSMLVMIDKIHETFKNETNLWEKLTDSENPPIGFYFLPLKDMGLSDSLYIKMNSRGKPLTNFEHFKAEFEKTIKGVSEDLYKEFIKKADIDWVDMLWKYRNDNNSIDNRFMNYFRYVSEMISYEQDLRIENNDFDLANTVYGVQNKKAEDNLKFLFNSFDCWLEIDNKDFFNSIFSNSVYEDGKVCLFSEDNNLFSLCCSLYSVKKGKIRGFSLNNSLFLYGVIQYLTHKDQISDVQFKERIRILRNLIANSQFEIRETRFKGLLSDVQELILNGKISEESGGFGKVQKEEEIEKISWRAQNSILIPFLNKLEDHKLLEGSVTIIDLTQIDNFSDRVNNFIKLFDFKKLNSDKIWFTKISRAMLTIDDYSQLRTFRFLLGGHTEKTWRELLRPSNQRKGFDKTRKVLCKLLDGMKGETDVYIQDLIDNYKTQEGIKKDWRYYFVKYPAMRKGNSGCYNWYNDDERNKKNPYRIWMMNTPSSLSGRHWSPFLYAISLDERIKDKVYLGEYGDKLIIRNSNQKVECKNSYWAFLDEDGTELDTLIINQTEGIDTEDRIEKIITYILK